MTLLIVVLLLVGMEVALQVALLLRKPKSEAEGGTNSFRAIGSAP